jgi:CO/xanthine dehydrogenase FAD-binding subunit
VIPAQFEYLRVRSADEATAALAEHEEALARGASPEQAAEHAAEGTEAPGDINETPEYREHLARVLVRRALEAASA